MSTFTYHGRTLNRFDHLYNSTAISERGVEVAVATDFLAWREGGITLEVGNVLSHYEPEITVPYRRIVDLYEVAQGVENIDLFDIDPESGPFDQIVSISTVEHVGFDYEPKQLDGPLHAIEHLRTLLSEKGTLLVTFGVGFNPSLDADTRALSFVADRSTYLNRRQDTGWASEWYETANPDNLSYGTVTPWANTVWIGEFTRG